MPLRAFIHTLQSRVTIASAGLSTCLILVVSRSVLATPVTPVALFAQHHLIRLPFPLHLYYIAGSRPMLLKIAAASDTVRISK